MMAYERGYSSSLNHDWWDTQEAKKFMNERKSNPSFDKEVDEKLLQIVNEGDVIITSYTLPWLTEGPIKFWLKGSQDNRAKRMANRDNISFFEAREIIKMRDEENKQIYSNLYGFNFGIDLDVFDFSLNTDLLNLDSLLGVSKYIIRNLGISKTYT